AFNKSSTTGTDVIKNNIFDNGRSNASGTGKHYAVRVNTLAATSDFNVFYANGTGGVLGQFSTTDKTTLAAWQAANGGDASSSNADPIFTTPNGTSGTVNLHITAGTGYDPLSAASNAGTPIGTVTNDVDNDSRD